MNTAECTFEIEVIDVQDPIIGCPQDVTISTDADVCQWTSQAGSLTPSVAIENCGADLQWSVENPDGTTQADSGDVSGYVFALGESIVTYTLRDSTGAQVDECNFRVTVEDREAPIVSCPSDEVLSASTGDCFLNLSPELTDIEASDNCTVFDDLEITYEVQGPDNSLSGPLANGTDFDFAVGISQVTFTVVDESGNASSCTYTLEITDEEAPVIDCPVSGNVVIGTSNLGNEGDCLGTYEWTHPEPTDNCEIVLYDYRVIRSDGTIDGPFDLEPLVNGSPNQGFLASYDFPIGTSAVQYFVEDAAGNIDFCQFEVTVEDDEAPEFVNCPADTVTVGNDFSNCEGGVNWSVPIAEDNCEVSVAQTAGPTPGDILDVGMYTVTYIATDGNTNTAECTFEIEVIDVQEPIIGCPQDVTISADAGVCQWTSQAGSLSPSVAIENCEPNLQWSVENPDGTTEADSGDVSGYVFLLGESTVTYTLSDSTGTQVDECSFRVTVEDREAPVIEDCDQPLFNNAFVGTAGADCTWSATGVRTITDNCDSELDVEVQFTNPDGSLTVIDMPQQSGTDIYEISYVFDLGVTTYTIYATDDAGNVTTCTYQLTVIDEEAPTITCADLAATYDTDAGSCDYTVQGAEFDPVVDDNCAVESVINDYNATSSLANEVFPVGSTTVVWTVTDESGNTATCEIEVVVEDNENPVFVNCPDTITVGNNFSNCSGDVNWSEPIAEDNCEVAVARLDGPTPGGFLPVGEYEVSYEATDSAGNTAICTFIVEVTDTQGPIIGCPDDVTVNTDVDVCEWTSQTGSLAPTVAIENCAPELVWSVANPDGTTEADSGDVSGYVFDLGESVVTYTLSDSTGSQVANVALE